MKIGVLYEGKLDFCCVKILIDRILNCGDNDYVKYPALGQIISKMPAALALFKVKNTELNLFFCDIDKKPSRKKQVKDFIKKHSEFNIIPAFCDPHFEEWFVSEQNTIVDILGINPEYQFKSDSQRANPKEMITGFINYKYKKDKEETRVKSQFYNDISEKLNMGVLETRDKNFKLFKQELDEFLKLSNQ